MRLLAILLVPVLFWGGEISLEFLNDKPRSIEKDFYIWRYLDQDISAKEAEAALHQAYRPNSKIFLRYADKIEDAGTRRALFCRYGKVKISSSEDAACIAAGISPGRAAGLGRAEVLKIMAKLKEASYLEHQKWLEVFASQTPYDALLKASDSNLLKVFNGCGSNYREQHFNRAFPKKRLDRLKNASRFYQMTKLIMTTPELDKVRQGLLKITDVSGVDHKAAFFLALNAIREGQNEQALKMLETINAQKPSPAIYNDRALLWRYLLTQDKRLLESMMQSPDINIYGLYAAELLGRSLPHEVTNSVVTNDKAGENAIDNPFFFMPFHGSTKHFDSKQRKQLQQEYNHPETEPHLALVLMRSGDRDKHFYLRPYRKYLNELEDDRQAMIYALGRQESYFIPGAVSISYALGMMQIMPFNVEAIAKQRKQIADLDAMFKPEKNLEFANHLIDQLTRKFKHPLFISYAYNGGWGFTDRMLKKKLFGKGRFEPFMSMELVPYDESKYYGKRVLSNYIVYSRMYGKEISVKQLLDGAVTPYL